MNPKLRDLLLCVQRTMKNVSDTVENYVYLSEEDRQPLGETLNEVQIDLSFASSLLKEIRSGNFEELSKEESTPA